MRPFSLICTTRKSRLVRTWPASRAGTGASCGQNEGMLVAYFSAEFGITECLTIFAGGLGMLAGDHLKAASDLGVPLVGVGLLYQQGYFRQYLNAAGWQQERYEDNDFQNLPITLERRADGRPLTVEVRLRRPAGSPRRSGARAVGRMSLFLLDTNVAGEPARGPRHHRPALRRRDRRCASSRKIMLGHRRLPRAGGARPRAHGLSHERGALGVSVAGARAAADGAARPRLRRGARSGMRRPGLHHPHAGSRRGTITSPPACSITTSATTPAASGFPARNSTGWAARIPPTTPRSSA